MSGRWLIVFSSISGMVIVVVGYVIAWLLGIPFLWSLFVTLPLSFLWGMYLGRRPHD